MKPVSRGVSSLAVVAVAVVSLSAMATAKSMMASPKPALTDANIAAIVRTLPDMRLSVAEHAHADDVVFIRWVMHATGDHGPFEITGIDRIRVRGGQVAENVIVFDTATFEARSGKSIPWT